MAQRNYFRSVRERRLKMGPTALGALLGCGHDAVLHNENEVRESHTCSLLALYSAFDAEPDLMTEILFFQHVPRREKIDDLELKRLIKLAKVKLATRRFEEWKSMMKKKFFSNLWVHIERTA